MESWFKDVGRPALLEAFAAACDRVGDDFDSSAFSPEIFMNISWCNC